MNDTQGMLGGAGLICGVIAFSIAIWHYRQGRRWRRLELMAREVDEFEGDAAVQGAMLLLDHPRRILDLGTGPQGGLPTFVDEGMLVRALHVEGATYDMEFTIEETAIRDMFEAFLGYLARFENHIRVGLIEEEDLRFHLARPLDLIAAGRGRHEGLVRQFWAFAQAKGYDDVKSLHRRYVAGAVDQPAGRRGEPTAMYA